MSEKSLLSQLVERYGNLKTEMDSYKKQVEADNAEIKKIMKDSGIDSFTAGGYTASYSVAVSENFDEDKLIAKLEHLTYQDPNSGATVCVGSGLGIIKMRPYVDMEALENAIYNGNVNAADLADCKVRKETPKLTIKKEKKSE